MPDPTQLTEPLCTKAWADLFFSESSFNAAWIDASNEKKLSALKSATYFIELYVTFFDDHGDSFVYTPDGTDDWDNDVIPLRLKQACAQEAGYLLSLDDNPAEPHPLTVLGLISADGKKFDKEYTPPIFPKIVVKLLRALGGEVDPETTGAEQMQVASKQTTC